MIPGVRLPSARQLAVRYSVAPKTADRALDQLVRKGLILRQRGRELAVMRELGIPITANGNNVPETGKEKDDE